MRARSRDNFSCCHQNRNSVTKTLSIHDSWRLLRETSTDICVTSPEITNQPLIIKFQTAKFKSCWHNNQAQHKSSIPWNSIFFHHCRHNVISFMWFIETASLFQFREFFGRLQVISIWFLIRNATLSQHLTLRNFSGISIVICFKNYRLLLSRTFISHFIVFLFITSRANN